MRDPHVWECWMNNVCMAFYTFGADIYHLSGARLIILEEIWT